MVSLARFGRQEKGASHPHRSDRQVSLWGMQTAVPQSSGHVEHYPCPSGVAPVPARHSSYPPSATDEPSAHPVHGLRDAPHPVRAPVCVSGMVCFLLHSV